MRTKWTLESIQKRADRYKTRTEFARGDYAAYQAAQKREDFEQICSHMELSKTKSYALEEIQLEANKYIRRSDFKKNSNGAYQAARKRHDMDEICAHMNPPKTRPYTLIELSLEAQKYKTRTEFQKGNKSMYNAAQKREDFEQTCSHMERPKNRPYSIEEMEVEAKRYLTVIDFKTNSPNIYQAAFRNKILGKVCSHMGKPGDVSLQEKDLMDNIKEIYPKAQRLRDKKVKIEGRPHITGFDIDIYIPELRKGIEFDGKYWHSDAGLKRSRDHWPDEDIRDYHSLKDSWFATKGIQILHIREEDWIEDKEACIKRCLSFISDNQS